MTRRKRYDPLVPRLYGTAEAAEYLGLSRKNLTAKLARGQVIAPVATLACGPIWSESQLDEQLFAWRGDPKGTWDETRTEQFTLARRLKVIERRWARLVDASMTAKDRKLDVEAIWRGDEAASRFKGKAKDRSARATRKEARHALAEAKLLRLVADLRDSDPVFRAISEELDEAANLRKEIEAVKKARRGVVVVEETHANGKEAVR